MINENKLYFMDELLIPQNRRNKNTKEEKVYRKHFNNMSKIERLYLYKLKENILRRGVNFARHALERMDERYIRERDVLKALDNGQILEYKKTNDDEILVIRGCTINKKSEHIYVILSVTNCRVITTYSNKHWLAYKKTKNLEKYNSDFDIKIPEYYKKKLRLYN